MGRAGSRHLELAESVRRPDEKIALLRRQSGETQALAFADVAARAAGVMRGNPADWPGEEAGRPPATARLLASGLRARPLQLRTAHSQRRGVGGTADRRPRAASASPISRCPRHRCAAYAESDHRAENKCGNNARSPHDPHETNLISTFNIRRAPEGLIQVNGRPAAGRGRRLSAPPCRFVRNDCYWLH